MTAASVSDFVVVPCRRWILDLSAIVSTLDLCAAASASVGVVLNACKSKSQQLEAKRALSDLVSEDDRQFCPVTLWDRTDYSRSLTVGQAVVEYAPTGKAAGEIAHLYKWLCVKVINP